MIYAIQCGEAGPIKLGRAEDPVKRMKHLQTSHHEKLRLLACEPAVNDEEAEKAVHQHLSVFRLRGEWFRPTRQVLELVERMGQGKAELSIFINRAKAYSEGVRKRQTKIDLINLYLGLKELVRRENIKNGQSVPA